MWSPALTDAMRNPPALRLLAVVLVAAMSGCSLFKAQHGSLEPQSSPADASVAGGVPTRVRQRFDHAVSLMQSGNTQQAEIELRDVVLLAPQLAAPVVDLSILYRKDGKLEEAEELLRTSATAKESAMVLTELGVTQRLRGEFRDAEGSYERAISVDPNYAPAYRDLGVVADLYLGDPQRALTAFERYKELTGEDKVVDNWIAELRVRTGQPAKKPAPAPTATAGAPAAGQPAEEAAPAAAEQAAPAAAQPPAPATKTPARQRRSKQPPAPASTKEPPAPPQSASDPPPQAAAGVRD
jgi:Flp pilus assembly protein TadD